MLRLITIGCILFCQSVFGASLQIQIDGLSSTLESKVRKDLTLNMAITEPNLTAKRIKNLYNIATNEINTTLYALSYYNASISNTLQLLDATQEKFYAHFIINLGPATTLNSVNLVIIGDGQDNNKLKAALTTEKLIIGQPLTHEDYEATKTAILITAKQFGYLNAWLSQSVIEVNRHTNQANVKFSLVTQAQYRFGTVHFADSIYDKNLLKRYIPFEFGEPYTSEKMHKFSSNLEHADLFSKFYIDGNPDFEDIHNTLVPIYVRGTAKASCIPYTSG